MPSKRTILTTLTTRELRTAIDDYELHVDDRLTGRETCGRIARWSPEALRRRCFPQVKRYSS